MYQIALVLLAAVSGGLSQQVVNGTCPIISGANAYNFLKHSNGTWYQNERIPNEQLGDCSKTTFNVSANGISVTKTEVYNKKKSFHYRTVQVDENTYKFNVTFSGNGTKDNKPIQYLLVATNDTSYAVIARCDESTNTTTNVTTTKLYAWKLSRRSSLTAADRKAIDDRLLDFPALAKAPWRATNFSEEACKSGAGSLVPSLVALVAAVLFSLKGQY